MRALFTAIAVAPFAIVAGACMPDVTGQIQAANNMVAQAQAAAQPRVTGTIQVNAASFPTTRCSSGQPAGYNGVEVMGTDASRIRLISEADTSSTVVYVASNGAATSLKSCGTVQVQPTGMTINGVRVVQGTAQFDCTKDALHVSGNLSFQCSL